MRTSDARRMHFARQKRTISRQDRTYRIPSVRTEKKNGKCRNGRSRTLAGRTREREPRKIRERAFTCVENLEKHRGPDAREQGGHRGTNTIKEAARTTWNGRRAI